METSEPFSFVHQLQNTRLSSSFVMAAICGRVCGAIPQLSLRFHSLVDPHSWPEFLGDSRSKRGTYGSLGRDLGIKGEAGHCEHPTDTKANKSLQLPAGGQPVPRGGCWIKRSPERLIGQGGLRKSEYNTTRCVTLYKPWCILFFSWEHFLLLLCGTLCLSVSFQHPSNNTNYSG